MILPTNPLHADLEHLQAHAAPDLWEPLRGQSVFITGGTGFFGSWLLESFAHVNRTLGLNAHAVVLTRDPQNFRRRAPHLAENPAIRLVAGDIRNLGRTRTLLLPRFSSMRRLPATRANTPATRSARWIPSSSAHALR